MPTLYAAPTQNFLEKTLSGAITDSVTTITLSSTTNMLAPGYIVVDRINSAQEATPNAREVIAYTGISGSDLTGCTRGADGSTARTHADGAIVETAPTIGMWNSLVTVISSAITSDGYLRAISSPVSIAFGEFNRIAVNSIASITVGEFVRLSVSSVASITKLDVGFLNISGASINGAFSQPNTNRTVSFATTGFNNSATTLATLSLGGTTGRTALIMATLDVREAVGNKSTRMFLYNGGNLITSGVFTATPGANQRAIQHVTWSGVLSNPTVVFGLIAQNTSDASIFTADNLMFEAISFQ